MSPCPSTTASQIPSRFGWRYNAAPSTSGPGSDQSSDQPRSASEFTHLFNTSQSTVARCVQLLEQQLAERAGTTVGSLNQYFPSRATLVAAVARGHSVHQRGGHAIWPA